MIIIATEPNKTKPNGKIVVEALPECEHYRGGWMVCIENVGRFDWLDCLVERELFLGWSAGFAWSGCVFFSRLGWAQTQLTAFKSLKIIVKKGAQEQTVYHTITVVGEGRNTHTAV